MSQKEKQSAVAFEGERRMHVGLAVRDLARSIAFYRSLLQAEPVKLRPRYAKFEVASPSLNLALNESGGATSPVNPIAHFGIQVKSSAAVLDMAQRLRGEGVEVLVEESTACCYAVQDKVWAIDPDGNKWEVFVVLEAESEQYANSAATCCHEPSATPASASSVCCGASAEPCCG
jgi:catechol 2,3-dioxygenase-like lactoylglutathione lyase family enzyme